MPGIYERERPEHQGIWGTVSLGLAVWAGEMKWLATRAMRGLEIRQLEKRLTEEHSRLGRMDAAGAKAADKAFARGQAAFLAEEIKRLRERAAEDRERFVAQRKKDLGLG